MSEGKMAMACGCCGGVHTTGRFYRNLYPTLGVDYDNVATASWLTYSVGGLDYWYYKLWAADVETETVSVIMQPIHYEIAEFANNNNPLPVFAWNSTAFETQNSNKLPKGSHISGGPITGLTSFGLWRTESGRIFDLPGEPHTTPGRNNNLGRIDGPTAPRRGVRPRYLRIWEDGEDLEGLIDLEKAFPDTPLSSFDIWGHRQTIPFADHPTAGAAKLTKSFKFRKDVVYAFDIYFELKIEPKDPFGAGLPGAGKCEHIILRDWSIPDYALSFAAPLSHFHNISFDGLPENVGFDSERHTYEVSLEFNDSDAEWVWSEDETEFVVKLDDVSNKQCHVSMSVEGPHQSSWSTTFTLTWNNREVPSLFVSGIHIDDQDNIKRIDATYRPDTLDYANESILPYGNGRRVYWGVDGVWDAQRSTYFYPVLKWTNPHYTHIAIDDWPTFVPQHSELDNVDKLPWRIKVTKVKQTPSLKMTMRFTNSAGFVTGNTIDVYFELTNVADKIMRDCRVTTVPLITGVPGQTVDIQPNQSQTISGSVVVTSDMETAGYFEFVGYATGMRNSSARSSDPETFRLF